MPDITYRFVASGNEDVEKAFSGIEARAKASKKATDEAARTQRASAGSRRGASVEARRPISETEKLARDVARAQERTSKREADAAHRRDLSDLRKRSSEKRRELEKAARQEASAKKRAQQEAEEKRAQSIGVLKDLAGGAFLGIVGATGALIGQAARESLKLQETSARIAIQGRGQGEKFRSPDALRRSFEQTAINAPGQTAAGVADAVQRFVSLTGDLDTALKAKGSFAMIASASGADIGDVAEAAASLSQQFDIKDINDMTDALAALNLQGKNGAFELKDAAAQFQRLAAAGAAFGIPKGVQGVRTLGGLTQIARSGTGSAEQASTAVEAMLNAFKAKQKELGAAGISVFDKQGKARDVRDLLVESISKVGGSDAGRKQAGLLHIFEREGIRAISPLLNKYNETYQGTKGTDAEKTAAAVARLREEFSKAIDVTNAREESEEDASMSQQQATAKISTAWESIKAKTADSLLPALGDLADKVGNNSDALDPFIEAIGLAADALGAILDLAKGFGLIHEKLMTPEQRSAKAEKDLHRFDVLHKTATYSKEDLEKRKALVTEMNAANETLNVPQHLTKDEFIKRYVEAGHGRSTEQSAGFLEYELSHGAPGVSNDFLQGKMGETEAQRRVRNQYQLDLATDQGAYNPAGVKPLSTEEAQQALQQFVSSLKAANAQLAGQTQGNVITG